MKQLIASALLVGALGVLTNPPPADAQASFDKCLIAAVKSCDQDFAGGDPYTIAARGYCYLIRAGMCKVMERKL